MVSRVSSLSVLVACLATAAVVNFGVARPSFSGGLPEKQSDPVHSPIKQVCDPVNDYSGCRSS